MYCENEESHFKIHIVENLENLKKPKMFKTTKSIICYTICYILQQIFLNIYLTTN